MSAAIENELDRLRAKVEKLTSERDALAARVECLLAAIHEAVMMPVSVTEGTAEAEELQDLRDVIGVAAAGEDS